MGIQFGPIQHRLGPRTALLEYATNKKGAVAPAGYGAQHSISDEVSRYSVMHRRATTQLA